MNFIILDINIQDYRITLVALKVSNHQLISLRFSTKFVLFRAYLVILS